MKNITEKNYFLWICNVLVLLFYYFLLQWLYDDGALFLAACLYIIQMVVMRVFFLADMRKAHRSMLRGDIAQAIQLYTQAETYFKQHQTLDTYRAFFLLTSNKFSFQEMAIYYKEECQKMNDQL
jgi:hypothetical protein